MSTNIDPNLNPTPLISQTDIKKQLAKTKCYMKITIGYNKHIVPYEDGLKIQEGFKYAEWLMQAKNDDWSDERITPLKKDEILMFEPMSEKEYIDKKMSHVLDTKVEL